MKTWDDLKEELKSKYPYLKEDVEEMEDLARIVSTIIERRNELGYSQRDLARMCKLPHSSIARIESCSVKPNVDTLLKILRRLGLTIVLKTA